MAALIDNSVDLWGKTVNNLQYDVNLEGNKFTGELTYVDDYTSAGFDMSKGNHFVVLQATSGAGVSISFDFNSKTKDLDSDGILVLQLTEETKLLPITYTATKEIDGETYTTTKTFDLSELELKAQA